MRNTCKMNTGILPCASAQSIFRITKKVKINFGKNSSKLQTIYFRMTLVFNQSIRFSRTISAPNPSPLLNRSDPPCFPPTPRPLCFTPVEPRIHLQWWAGGRRWGRPRPNRRRNRTDSGGEIVCSTVFVTKKDILVFVIESLRNPFFVNNPHFHV